MCVCAFVCILSSSSSSIGSKISLFYPSQLVVLNSLLTGLIQRLSLSLCVCVCCVLLLRARKGAVVVVVAKRRRRDTKGKVYSFNPIVF